MHVLQVAVAMDTLTGITFVVSMNVLIAYNSGHFTDIDFENFDKNPTLSFSACTGSIGYHRTGFCGQS